MMFTICASSPLCSACLSHRQDATHTLRKIPSFHESLAMAALFRGCSSLTVGGEEDVGGEKECRRLEEWTGLYMP